MITAFKEHIRQKSLLDENFSYLFACSGGIDSMVLGDLLLKSDIQFEVAHVNFGLRSHESDGDEEFVKKWAEKNQLRLHNHHADAMAVAEEKKISIQMAAREIRYAWFEKLNTERKLSGIILAHQEDDQLETIFLNLLRGTGMEGIQGMADRKGLLIRPLLPFSRGEIENYAKENGISWREDSSNLKTDYKRNKLRLEALPALYEVASDAR
ncbi:MAG TPA: tRNA lysidine(34) synthetase TilS, partial [Algoriphagus sp.]|nr:tRNA lysidine(34) synthetase TilS [Algoriphagus sp.]